MRSKDELKKELNKTSRKLMNLIHYNKTEIKELKKLAIDIVDMLSKLDNE